MIYGFFLKILAITDLNRSKVSGEMADILLKCLPTQDEAIALAKHASQLDKLAVTFLSNFLFLIFSLFLSLIIVHNNNIK